MKTRAPLPNFTTVMMFVLAGVGVITSLVISAVMVITFETKEMLGWSIGSAVATPAIVLSSIPFVVLIRNKARFEIYARKIGYVLVFMATFLWWAGYIFFLPVGLSLLGAASLAKASAAKSAIV